MVSSGMLRHVALVRTDVSEEPSASFITVTRFGELGTTPAVTSNRRTLRRNTKLLVTGNFFPSSPILVTLMKEALSSSESSVLTRATRRNIPGDAILHLFLTSCSLSRTHTNTWYSVNAFIHGELNELTKTTVCISSYLLYYALEAAFRDYSPQQEYTGKNILL
jgi:hypothetical protein